MLYVVDRIEKDILILEGDEDVFYSVPRALLPEAKEGDCVEIHINKEETEKRREKVRRLMEELFQD
ncbi:MAG: DUF3006 domain-containing protein [Clostridia bacterium]|nr:DUF3006 domain-containing protein [Clostridia bacterium]